MKRNIHVVPHFHWDREWYFTAEESKILLANDFAEVLDFLEAHPDYPYFVLDGQTAILEDYLALRPEDADRIRSLVQAGRLLIGPWYTQTDEMVVGGESIVRNLLYGKLDCTPFGSPMAIGYLPDSFGQTARLPQILNGFGIRRCMFWRGSSERKGADTTEFVWQDDDGSRVTVQLLPLGYAIGKYLPQDETQLKARLDKYLPVLDKGATTDHILLPNGHDQMPIQKNIREVLEKIERLYPGRKAFLSRYEDVFAEVEKNPALAVLQGEFLDGKYMRVHRSIYSSRADLKAANTRIENKITQLLEPLMSIAYALGIPYQHGLVEAIWKELLKNHAHDSIGCCCSDAVHRAIADRFFLAEDRTDALLRFYARRIVDAMPCDRALDKLAAFNLLPYEKLRVVTGEIVTKMKGFVLTDETGRRMPFEVVARETVDAGLIDRQIVHYGDYDPFVRYTVTFADTLPAMGYKTYLVEETAEPLEVEVLEGIPADALENAYYRVRVAPNGTLEIEDKTTREVYRDVLLLEDGGDDGDGYDYSPPANDRVITSREVVAQTQITRRTHRTEAKIQLELPVPKDLASRVRGLRDGLVRAEIIIALEADSPIIETSLRIDNAAADHRLRVLVPQAPMAASVSDNPFGCIERPAVDDAMTIWQAEGWTERPDAIYPFLSYVKPATGTGVAVLTNSVREFEIVGANTDTIAVTLFRGVGVLGKENLLRRPGRPSGIKLPTPDSQLLGAQTYRLALTTRLDDAARLAKEYLTPIVTYNKMPHDAMKLNAPAIEAPYHFSLFALEGEGVVLSALKKAEQSETLVLRCYNAARTARTARLVSDKRLVAELQLDESVKRPLVNTQFEILPNQALTFALE